MDIDTGLVPSPVSGRRRAAPPVQRRVLGLPVPWLVATVVAVAGALLVLAGVLRATVYAPSPVVHATLTGTRRPVVSTAVGLLGLHGPRLEVDARDGSRRPVFIGVGRAADVDAYLAQVSRAEVVGRGGDGGARTRNLGSQASLPQPGAADVWVVSERGTGSETLVWPDAPGQWRLVVATDGTAPAPGQIRFTWTGRDVHTAAPALLAVGLVLLVAGLITLVMLSSRQRLEASR